MMECKGSQGSTIRGEEIKRKRRTEYKERKDYEVRLRKKAGEQGKFKTGSAK